MKGKKKKYGILKSINELDNYTFEHLCSTDNGASGSPILNIKNNKVIGIHKEAYKNKRNRGTFLNYPIKDFIIQSKVLNPISSQKQIPISILNSFTNKNTYIKQVDVKTKNSSVELQPNLVYTNIKTIFPDSLITLRERMNQ